MAQITTWPIPSGPSGLAMRQQVNLITEALRTSNSGATAPTPTVAGMLWYDTSVTPGIQKIRNSANDGWFVLLADNSDESTQLSQLAGRNLIINGSGRINQRRYVSGTATGAANQFTLDRWFVVTSGQNLTFTGTDAGRTMTAPAGGVSQVIQVADIVGGTYVINWTGTATATVDGVARLKGDTFTLTGNTNATVRFTGGTYTDVQIELGTVPTVFERGSLSIDSARCAWFFRNIFLSDRSRANEASEPSQSLVSFPPMRATPTATFLSSSYTTNVASVNLPSIGDAHIVYEIISTTAGDALRGDIYSLNAELTS